MQEVRGRHSFDHLLEHLPRLPKDFARRIQRLLFPESAPDGAVLEWQRTELAALVKEVKELVS